ncbi:MAG: F0F1 ATP synthase subunit A [Anaerolineae bacterium]|nr:F0F1 ATP synthase subunit A [Anaerolineae bacterium]NIN98358.1 F0F1 ATP synthase subunit A [Anaerolineae bacterium]NIQ81281.1 F0F1 ATP synthase subunit A [Anaerolineae bacterium]
MDEMMSDAMKPVMGEEGCLPGCMTGKGCLVYIIVIAIAVFLAMRFPVVMPEVALPAEPIATIPVIGFTVTNSLLATWLTMLLLIVGSILVTRRLKMVPSGLQNLLEWGLGALLGLCENVGGERGRKFFPLVATIFVFLLISNWMGLLPGFASVGLIHPAHHGGNQVETVSILGTDVHILTAEEVGEHESGYTVFSFLRSAATDLNTGLALALISVVATQVIGVQALGLRYFKKFISFDDVLGIVVGPLELVSELAKIISFSFRLFGNIFAGEVLLAVLAVIVPYLISIPFYGLEMFVGLMQALVFGFLTLVFMSMATVGHGSEGEEH